MGWSTASLESRHRERCDVGRQSVLGASFSSQNEGWNHGEIFEGNLFLSQYWYLCLLQARTPIVQLLQSEKHAHSEDQIILTEAWGCVALVLTVSQSLPSPGKISGILNMFFAVWKGSSFHNQGTWALSLVPYLQLYKCGPQPSHHLLFTSFSPE